MSGDSGPPRRSLLVLSAANELRRFDLDLSEVVIGRDGQCDVVLDEARVSREHARIRVGDTATLEDLGSRNGTRLNGTRVGAGPVEIVDGDWIEIGSARLRYLDPKTRADAPSGARASDPLVLETLLDTALTAGGLHTLAVQNTGLIDSGPAEEAILRVVLRARPSARLVVREDGVSREHPLPTHEGLPLTLGRDPEVDLRLTAAQCSGRHARIERAGGRHVLSDLGSRNGTLVNGTSVARHDLRDGDLIRIGSAEIVFRAEGEAGVSARARRRPVVIVPGLAACELYRGGERIWPNPMRLFSCPEARLRQYWEEVDVHGIIREQTVVPGLMRTESFGSLVRHLEALGYAPGEDLLEFPYDWRRDNAESARALAAAIATWRARRTDPTEKITVVAHSMGGLVARYWIGCLGGADAVERIVFLGSPHEGSVKSLLSLVAGVSPLPFGVALRKVRLLALGFPSVYQLLPANGAVSFEDGSPFDPFAADDWLEPSCRRHLAAAARFRRELAQCRLEVPATSVFGYEQSTLLGLRLRRDRNGRVEVRAEERGPAGDGWVSERSAVLAGSEIHPVIQQHGALHADRDVLRRLQYELCER